MLRKALTLGMVFILALSLLAVSMITCFTYEAEAHAGGHYYCEDPCSDDTGDFPQPSRGLGLLLVYTWVKPGIFVMLKVPQGTFSITTNLRSWLLFLT